MPPDDIKLSHDMARAWIFTVKSELGSALWAVMWGIMSRMDNTGLVERPSLNFMSHIAHDSFWEGAAVFFGIVQFIAVWVNSYQARFVAACFMSWLLWEISASFLANGLALPNASFPITFLIMNMATVSRYSLYVLWKVRHPKSQGG